MTKSKFPPKRPDNSHIIKLSPKRNWSDFQKAIFKDIAKATDHTVVIARAGSGKCLGKGTKVLCFNGSIKNVEDIKTNDLLMGPDSIPRKVLSTTTGCGNLVKIIPVKGEPWICNDVHMLTLTGTNAEAGKIIDISVNELREKYHHFKDVSKNWKLFTVPVDFPNSYPLPLDPYLVGIWIGDGTTSQPTITSMDPEIINYCNNVAPKYNLKVAINQYKQTSKVKTIRFYVGHRGEAGRNTPHPIRRFFREQCGGKENCKIIPQEYLTASKEDRLQLLAGIIDTDGHYREGYGYFEVVTTSKKLADQYVFLAKSLGFAVYSKVKKTSIKSINYIGTAYRINIIGNVEKIPTKLPRKQAIPRNQIKRHNVNGFKIEDIGQGEYFGFTLDGDGRFLLGDFTVTHNTSTIVEGFKYLPRGKKTLMVAFNKSIAEELKQRAPSYVDVMTLHSLGFRAIKQVYGNDIVLETDKSRLLIEGITSSSRDDWELNQSIAKCVSLCKGFLFDVPRDIDEIIERFGLEIFDMKREKYIETVVKTMGLCKMQTKVIDFDDMIWFPFVHRLNVGKFDVVFVDEAQDLNAAQMAMVYSALRPTGRIIAVGDPAQSIYQFRGADSEAIPNFINKLKAKTLPLSVTYRCPWKVVELAKEIVPDIEACAGAPAGIVEELSIEHLTKSVRPGDFVLSRTNAPLIKYCMQLLKAGVPANIQGRDVGSNLQYFVKKSKAKTIDAFVKYVNEWRESEIKRLLSEKKNTEVAIDKAECLLNLCEGTLTIKDLKETIEKLFNDVDDTAKVIFSTTHKAKGLERDRVFILAGTYRKGSGEQEENNLWYVAITRCKKELYLVRKPGKYSPFDDKPSEAT